jgi:hypothetical protein
MLIEYVMHAMHIAQAVLGLLMMNVKHVTMDISKILTFPNVIQSVGKVTLNFSQIGPARHAIVLARLALLMAH